jgi:hypothetical protein
MLKHFYKHLDLFDKLFIVFLVSFGILTAIVGAWETTVYLFVLLLFVFIMKSKDIVIKHQEDLIERLLEVAEYATKALDGGKLVKKTTIEFSIEKSKAKEGNKPNEKQRNEDTPNAGRSRSGASKKRAGSSKTSNAKGTGTASVPNRKPKTAKKNSKA